MSLKLIQDPATGKPRGFGFCEYEDAETAMSACRNLAGRELNGRPLRVDSAMNAPGENIRSSVNISVGPVEPPVHGSPVSPENAPEAITKAVASLPPEQMFELMKQMKWCIQHNPNETRQLLLHNPQLAYALLQAQVVMKIVDLDTAQKLLHRTPRGQPLQPEQHHPPPHHPPPARDLPPGPSQYGPPHGGERPGGWHQNPGRPQRGGARSHGDPRQQAHRMSPHADFPIRPAPPPPDLPPDQEKTLLMQVLSLSDDQIQLLPADQRTNILRLKEQIAQNRQ